MPPPVAATRFEQAPNLEMRFPPLPGTVLEVSRLLAEETDSPDTQRLAEVAHHDPIVATAVLRRINSAYYGMTRLVADIKKAVYLLGFIDVSNLVATAALLRLREVLSSPEQERIFRDVMKHSIVTAHVAQDLARSSRLAKASLAFTSGLLHSAGRLVLLYNKPQVYEALWFTNDDGMAPTAEAERLIFGTDHTALGALAAEQWHLPPEIVRLIQHCAAPGALPNRDLRLMGYALALAAREAESICRAPGGRPGQPSGELLAFANAAGLPPAAVSDLMGAICARLPENLTDLLDG